MAGINRAYNVNKSESRSNLLQGKECVFISHHKSDLDDCKKIADYLMKANIDVYLDEYDYDLKEQVQKQNPKGVVNCISKGISNSTHMLCVLSSQTIYSKWVPWELGYGYDKTDLGAITLKGIAEASLPDYLKTVRLIRGTQSLNQYISDVLGYSKEYLKMYSRIDEHLKPYHYLDNVLDWQL
tara:strand:- start:2341 stop:2889 length:549 start_codon:yes stop_codon:yes gene_type:complete